MANPASRVASAKDGAQYVKDGTARGDRTRLRAGNAKGGISGPLATSTADHRQRDHGAAGEPRLTGDIIRRDIEGDPVGDLHGARRADNTTPREEGDLYTGSGTTTAACDQAGRDATEKGSAELPRQGRRAQPSPGGGGGGGGGGDKERQKQQLEAHPSWLINGGKAAAVRTIRCVQKQLGPWPRRTGVVRWGTAWQVKQINHCRLTTSTRSGGPLQTRGERGQDTVATERASRKGGGGCPLR